MPGGKGHPVSPPGPAGERPGKKTLEAFGESQAWVRARGERPREKTTLRGLMGLSFPSLLELSPETKATWQQLWEASASAGNDLWVGVRGSVNFWKSHANVWPCICTWEWSGPLGLSVES